MGQRRKQIQRVWGKAGCRRYRVKFCQKKNTLSMSLGSSLCAELFSVIEGTDFHFKFDASFRTLSTNFSELWIKHLEGRLIMLKLNVFFFFAFEQRV